MTPLEIAYFEGVKLACLNAGLDEEMAQYLMEKQALSLNPLKWFRRGEAAAAPVAETVTQGTKRVRQAAPRAPKEPALNKKQFNQGVNERMANNMTTKWLPYLGAGGAVGAGVGYATAEEGQELRGALTGGLAGLGAGAGARMGAGKGLVSRAKTEAELAQAQMMGAKGKAVKKFEDAATVAGKQTSRSGLLGLGGMAAGGAGGYAAGNYLMPAPQPAAPEQAFDPYLAQQAQMMGYMPY